MSILFGCFPSFYACCPCKSNVVTNKPYDLFVSYNKSSEKWIEANLVPFLDSFDSDYTYFLHYDEENTKEEIYGSFIQEKIDNSCFILLVLSDAFLMNEWANEEYKDHIKRTVLKVAKTNEEKTRLLCVQLHDVSDEEVDEYIRNNLQIPRFVSLETDEFFFWKKLGYFLYVNRDYNEEIVPVNSNYDADQITVSTRDVNSNIRPDDLLNFKQYKIQAPLVHLPSDSTHYKIKKKKSSKQRKNDNSYNNESYTEAEVDYTPDLVQQSILTQLAARKKQLINDEVIVNLDNPVRQESSIKSHVKPVIVKTRDDKIEFAVPESDNNYRIVSKKQAAMFDSENKHERPRLLSVDSNDSFY